MQVTNTKCSVRQLKRPDTAVFAAAMKELGIRDGDLPLETDTKPFHALPSFTQEEAFQVRPQP